MDARWFGQAVGGSTDNNSRFNCAGSTVDLSLKLGLTNKQEDENELQLGLFPKSLPASPKLANLTFNGSPITEETNQHEMGDGRGKVGVNSKGLVAGRGNSSINSHGLSNVGGGAAMHNHGTFPGWYQVTNNHGYNGGGGSSGVNSSPYNQQELNVNQELLATLGYNLSNYNPGGMPPLMPTTNNYTLLDHVPRSAGRETGNSSGSLKRSSRQQREKSYFDPNKRCTNYNCNTNNTPMWRKGPLGPKTLCNACGIKYRKEEERRRAGEANGPKV